MSSENGWIPWNERKDLECAYLFQTGWNFDIDTICRNSDMDDYIIVENDDERYKYDLFGIEAVPDYMIYENDKDGDSLITIVPLGKVPVDYFAEIRDKVWKLYGTSVLIEICQQSELKDYELNRAIQYSFYCKNGGKKSFLYRRSLEARDYFESIDKEKYNYLLNTSQSLTVSDSPAVPAVPVAGVERPIGRNENYPSTWIYAKGDETASEFTDNGAAEMVQVGLQSSILTAIQDGFDKVIERQDKAIEIQQQTANNTTSINIKTVGKISRLEDIPPYNPTCKNWVSVAKYAEIISTSRENLDSMRSRGDNKAPDNNSGIHGEHCWRRVNDKIFYYVYQPKYLDLL